jgi:glutamate/tyrosine decarboxylase-like PLP-dependent enzyme
VGERELFRQVADYAADFVETLDTRPIRDSADTEELCAAFGGPLPDEGIDDETVLASIVEASEPGLVASPSGRYFGFVVGGSLPAATAADWMATAWDVNAGGWTLGPAAMVMEDVARSWIADVLGLPSDISAGFVTGCQMAHVTALAAARHHVLTRAGWDLARDGLAGSPPLRVVVGEKRHVTIDRALRLLGIGSSSLVVVPSDDQGRMRTDDRVRPGGRGQHRRVRRSRRDRRRGRGNRGLVPRRRSVRALGGCVAAVPASHTRRGTRRLVGERRT